MSLFSICPLWASKPFSVHYMGLFGQNSNIEMSSFHGRVLSLISRVDGRMQKCELNVKRFFIAVWMMTTFLIEKSIAVHEPRDTFSSCWELFPPGLIPLAHHQVRVFLGHHASSWIADILTWALAARLTVLSETESPRVTHIESCFMLLTYIV